MVLQLIILVLNYLFFDAHHQRWFRGQQDLSKIGLTVFLVAYSLYCEC